ncbi:hypothetical protein ACPV5R_11700 [Vibrio astriarenae]
MMLNKTVTMTSSLIFVLFCIAFGAVVLVIKLHEEQPQLQEGQPIASFEVLDFFEIKSGG